MLVGISASPSGPLKVIGSLPDANLAILEGYNGIGKTLAIRILQLCTGTMPYAMGSPAWESLCEGLNKITVKISNIQGAKSIVWEADSADWKAGDEPNPRDGWFKSIKIDGKKASLDDVRRLIKVIRLAGDEDLTDTFAHQIEAHAATLQRWTAKHANPEQGPLKQLEDLAGIADDLLSDTQIAKFSELQSKAGKAKQNVEKKRKAAEQLRTRRSQINDALELRRRIRYIRTKAPEVQSEIDEVDKRIAEKELEQETAEKEFARLAAEVGRTEPLRKELKNAERILKRNLVKLNNAWNQAAGIAVELEIETEGTAATRLLNELIAREGLLKQQQQEQDKAPKMIQLLEAVSSELGEAESKGFGDQVAVDHADSGVQLSVSQTRTGMVTRRTHLQQEPPPPDALDISEKLDAIRERKSQVERLLETLGDVNRFKRLVNKNQERIRKALEKGAGQEAAEALKSAADRRFQCDQALQKLADRRAELAQQLGRSTSATSELALSGQLHNVLVSLGLAEERIELESQVIEKRLRLADDEHAVARIEENECRMQLAQTKTRTRDTVARLESEEDLRWVREALTDEHYKFSGDDEQLHQVVVRAHHLAHAVLDRLGTHRDQLSAIQRALQGTARLLRGQTADAQVYVEEVMAWLALSFSDWFNDSRVRGELLKNADEDQKVMVDLETRRVTWNENGSKRSRPLEAFSSGEQAFAYTRAQLAVLDDENKTAQNRLFVLDEFGAFISHHLLQGMLDYLREWTAERQNDRVLLVLPISRDYSQMDTSAIGEKVEQYASFAKQVEDHGYMTRTIVQ